jgi:glycerol-3-phosphate O-acyltransferase
MGASVEVEVPSVARKPPVADVGDLPGGRRFDFNDEIHATTVCAVDLTPAEGHATTVPNTTDLPGREPERDQDRIKDLRNQAWTTLSRPRWNRAWFNPRLSLVWLARPRHDWRMVSEAGPKTHAKGLLEGRG